ncbi:hypothetical protein HDE_02156 [Halotydeus destructor]|nr:hypothetical protein HDE_02156 [Halotydeus destructor]
MKSSLVWVFFMAMTTGDIWCQEVTSQSPASSAAPFSGRDSGPVISVGSGSGSGSKINVLEVLKGVGSAIQLLVQNRNQLQGSVRSDQGTSGSGNELSKEAYREQALKLRSEINRRSEQLQKVVVAASEALKDRGDVMVRRILVNLNARLGQARARADKILSEPESSELAVKTLHTINQGLNNLNALVHQVLARVNISINVNLKEGASVVPVAVPAGPVPLVAKDVLAPPVLEKVQ